MVATASASTGAASGQLYAPLPRPKTGAQPVHANRHSASAQPDQLQGPALPPQAPATPPSAFRSTVTSGHDQHGKSAPPPAALWRCTQSRKVCRSIPFISAAAVHQQPSKIIASTKSRRTTRPLFSRQARRHQSVADYSQWAISNGRPMRNSRARHKRRSQNHTQPNSPPPGKASLKI